MEERPTTDPLTARWCCLRGLGIEAVSENCRAAILGEGITGMGGGGGDLSCPHKSTPNAMRWAHNGDLLYSEYEEVD